MADFIETQEESTTEEGVGLDTSLDTGDTTPQDPPAPAPNELDWRALYAQSIRERQERDAELAQLRAQLTQPKPEAAPREEDITDADIERLGTTGVIKEIVARTLRKELQSSLGDVGEISRDFKRNKMVEQSEQAFFNQFPHLAQFRETLAPTIRGQLQNASQIDPSTYATQAFATIGYYTAMNAAQPQQNTPAPTNVPRQNIPPSRTNGAPTPASRSLPRLSELERTGMKKIGLDPNKREHVEEFLALVNNDEGITV
jgi:hypothetical protein